MQTIIVYIIIAIVAAIIIHRLHRTFTRRNTPDCGCGCSKGCKGCSLSQK